MPETELPGEVPVGLLSEALLELKAARGNRPAQREAAIRYFKTGIAKGYELGPLLNWLFFWPNDRDSVAWQARLDVKFLEMLKKITLGELNLGSNESQNSTTDEHG